MFAKINGSAFIFANAGLKLAPQEKAFLPSRAVEGPGVGLLACGRAIRRLCESPCHKTGGTA